MAIGWLILGALIFMSAVMAAAWQVQRRAGDSGWVDVFWTFGTGVAGAGAAVMARGVPIRQGLVAVLVVVWALRLGAYIAARVAKGPEDSRYQRLREAWGERYQRRLFWFMQLQAPVSALLCLSIALAAADPTPMLRLRDGLAVLILGVAIAGESIADVQLARFRGDPANRGEVNDRGLWSWSRHPNYFFEWFGWLAYPVMALEPARPITWLSLMAPALMYLVLTRLTGVAYLEQHMAQSRGERWTAYARRTSSFFPLPPKRTSP
jgi:steroid 5-alpha reductase family enzyme